MIRILLISVLLLAPIPPSTACTMVNTDGAPERVKPSFFVKVKGFGEAIANVQVEAAKSGPLDQAKPVFVALSDTDGYAGFHDLPLGNYVITVKDRFRANTSVEVVAPEQTPIYYVYVGWPQERASVALRRPVGRIGGRCEKLTCTISLLDARTASRLAPEVHDAAFDFGVVSPDAYMLRVESWSGGVHFVDEIPIRISPNAEKEALNISVGYGGGCG